MKTTLVSTEELAANLQQWRVFDCRHELAAPEKGEALYLEGHIPGAIHAHLDRTLSGAKTGGNGRHPLPQPEQFAQWLAAAGVSKGDQVVAYDDGLAAFAARFWWMLRWMGHDAVAVLDGGFAKWTKEGRPVNSNTPQPSAGSFQQNVQNQMRVDVGVVAQNVRRSEEGPALQLVDARGASRFAGQGETIDVRGGHIPGAVNRPYTLNLNSIGTFRTAEELRADFDALLGARPAASIVHQCGSGVTACHNVLAMEIAGLHGARLYPGSWSEWIADPARPVATGEQP